MLRRVSSSILMNSLTSNPTARPLARRMVRRNGESVTPDMGARISGVSMATSPILNPLEIMATCFNPLLVAAAG